MKSYREKMDTEFNEMTNSYGEDVSCLLDAGTVAGYEELSTLMSGYSKLTKPAEKTAYDGQRT
jgi:hypothetical protein